MGSTVALCHLLGMLPVCQTLLYIWSRSVVVVGVKCLLMVYGILAGPGNVSLHCERADCNSRIYISVFDDVKSNWRLSCSSKCWRTAGGLESRLDTLANALAMASATLELSAIMLLLILSTCGGLTENFPAILCTRFHTCHLCLRVQCGYITGK